MAPTESGFVPYQPLGFTPEETRERARKFYQLLNRRRSIRHFSDQPVDREVIEQLLLTAASAPSGAHKQPWTFCAVQDPGLKQRIRRAAEEEEYRSYHGRMSAEWLSDLAPLGTDWKKPFLETAPWLIVLFKKAYDPLPDGGRAKNYYVNESVGIAAGFLIAAIHQAGLVTLTHTPSPMNFLQDILQRPGHERPYLLLPVGYPAEDAQVPDLERKPAEVVIRWY